MGRWIVDDAGISFAYARSIALGHGPVVQAGAPPVEGYSNPTWVALLTIGRLLGLFDHGAVFGIPDYVLFPKALGLLCATGILVCFYLASVAVLPSRRTAALVTAAAGTVLAFVPTFVIWTFSGLENPLYALLVTLLAVILLRAGLTDPEGLRARRCAVLTGVIVALAALTRPDGVIYLADYPVVLLLSAGSRRLRSVLIPVAWHAVAFTVPFGLYLAWRRVEFGRWVPNTAVAKAQSRPSLENLNRVADATQYPGPLLSLVAVAVVAAAVTAVPQLRRSMVALVVPLALALTAYCVLNGDWMGQLRFASPVWPLAVLVTTLCAARLIARIGRRRRQAGVGVALAGSLYLGYGVLDPMLPASAANPVVPLCVVAAENGELFNEFADIAGVEQGTLLLPDLGGTALTSRLRLRDIAGLVDAPVADYLHNSDLDGLREYIYDTMKPTFIQTHGYWSQSLTHNGGFDPRLARDYIQIYPAHPAAPDASSDWIRKDALKDPADAARLQAHAQSTIPMLLNTEKWNVAGDCTASFHIGQGLTKR